MPQCLLRALTLSTGESGLTWELAPNKAVDAINEHGTARIPVLENEKDALRQAQALAESLYNLSKLRKRGQGVEE